MADVLAHIDTLDVEVAPQEELDVTVGSPMEHSRILSITKNGKYVVSEYDLAEVDVQPLPKQDKVVEITENGTTEVTPDEGRILDKAVVVVNVPDWKVASGYHYFSQYNIDRMTFEGVTSLSEFLFNMDDSVSSIQINWGDKTKDIKIFYRTFKGARIVRINSLNTHSAITFRSMCYTMRYCTYICELDCENLQIIDDDAFGSLLNRTLTYFGGLKNIGKSFTTAQHFVYPLLSYNEELVNKQIDYLWEDGKGSSIRFYTAVYNVLSEEQKKKITDKNWVILTQ